MKMEIQTNQVVNAEMFMAFLREFMEVYETNPKEWNNSSLYSFLDGMHDYMSEKGYFEKPPVLTWQLVAELFKSSALYPAC